MIFYIPTLSFFISYHLPRLTGKFYILNSLQRFVSTFALHACLKTNEMMDSLSESVPDYLDKNIFPVLLNAMEEMLLEAHRHEALETSKCFFNGLDCLAEILWNRNPCHPSRLHTWVDVFSIPQFKLWLTSHPRPIYPKSWLWTKEEAALRIQRYVRGWLVRKRTDVQEMRQFWKIIEAEKMDLSLSKSDCTSTKLQC